MYENDPVMLTWRYAALVGIVTPESAGLTDADVEADRERWPHLVKTVEGLPVFDLDEGAAFIAEISAQPLADCRRVLEEEWPE
jgi:hypothetical protein